VNLDEIEHDFDSRGGRHLKIVAPALNLVMEVEPTNFDKLRTDIFELAKQFPHKRMVLTHKTTEEEILLELHPITGAA
jgi:hypothetical protein